jgi:hypothetical protein
MRLTRTWTLLALWRKRNLPCGILDLLQEEMVAPATVQDRISRLLKSHELVRQDTITIPGMGKLIMTHGSARFLTGVSNFPNARWTNCPGSPWLVALSAKRWISQRLGHAGCCDMIIEKAIAEYPWRRSKWN